MYNQCPACATLFRVEEELPPEGEHWVRCGMCAEVFDARWRFAETLPFSFMGHVTFPSVRLEPTAAPAPPAAATAELQAAPDPLSVSPDSDRFTARALQDRGLGQVPGQVPGQVQQVVPAMEPTSKLAIALARRASSVAEELPAEKAVSQAEPTDTFDPFDPMLTHLTTEPMVAAPEDSGAGDGQPVDWHLASIMEVEQRRHPRDRAAKRGVGLWGAGIVLLLLVFVTQVIWFQRHDLAVYAQLRPGLEILCAIGDCELPLRQDRTQLQLVRAQVTEHPESAEHLLATATFRNNAGYRQPYPLLKLSLLDDDQNVVGERWFHPSEYLEETGQREHWRRGMPARQQVDVRFGVLDPGSGSAQYMFDYN